MPKRPRHLDFDLVRAVNPKSEDLLAPVAPPGPPPDAEAVRTERQAWAAAALKAIGEFVAEYPRDRYGNCRTAADAGQALGLAEALLQAMALLLKKDPERLRQVLEEVVYSDRSEPALAGARRALGILNRKTLKELLEGTEPYDWGDTDPGTTGAPIRHTPQGPVVEWPEGYRDRPPLEEADVQAFEEAARREGGEALLPAYAGPRPGNPAGQTGIQEPRWVGETKARFPRLFRGLDPFGFACGEGWKGIVTGLCERLEALGRPRLKIVQIKEKFGGLRIYVEGGNKATFALVQEAEAASSAVCERCGAPGTKTSDGRLLTLCPACQNKRKRPQESR